MKPTKGPWAACAASPSKEPTVWEAGIEAEGYITFAYAYGSREQAEADAEFIAAACNAARAVNPENPIRAAARMVEAIEALKKIANWDFEPGWKWEHAAKAREIARRAFLNATDREAK